MQPDKLKDQIDLQCPHISRVPTLDDSLYGAMLFYWLLRNLF